MIDENLVNIIRGRAEPENDLRDLAADALDIVAKVYAECNWGPGHFDGDPIVWRRREFNAEAFFWPIMR